MKIKAKEFRDVLLRNDFRYVCGMYFSSNKKMRIEILDKLYYPNETKYNARINIECNDLKKFIKLLEKYGVELK